MTMIQDVEATEENIAVETPKKAM